LLKMAKALFQPIQDVKVSMSIVDIPAGIAAYIKKRFDTGFKTRTNLKTSLDAAKDPKRRQSLASRIALKDMELEVLRNFYEVCNHTAQELRTQLPAEDAIDPSTVGEVAPLDSLDSLTEENQS